MKRIFFLLLSFCFVLSLHAQEEPEQQKGFDPNRLFFGGNIGASFANDNLFINIMPQVGYMFNRYLAAGAGVNFTYSSYRYYYANGAPAYKENYTNFGLNIFGRVYPVRFLFLQLQPEINYNWVTLKPEDSNLPDEKLGGKFVPVVLAGLGAAIPTGARGAFTIMVQYDLVQNDRSPYGSNAFVSFGYSF